MPHSLKFWIAMGVFQTVFGVAVFALTRHYYQAAHDVTAATGAGAARSPWADIARSLPNVASTAAPTAGGDPAALSHEADAHFASKRYEQAARGYEQLRALDPTNVDVLNNLGLTLHYLGRSREALERLAEGAALDPHHQRLWLTTGFVNLDLGNADEARAALEKAASLGTDAGVRESAEKMLATLAQ
jgi:tetratricopeptide (TPR) repeat protein